VPKENRLEKFDQGTHYMHSNEYRQAWERWAAHRPVAEFGAATRMSREEVNERHQPLFIDPNWDSLPANAES
jgi:hypothetical protein